MSALIAVFILLLFFAILGVIVHRIHYGPSYDEEEEIVTETVVTTTTFNPEWLHRICHQGGQYVIDPADGDKVWVQPTDDTYEDGAGRVWRLV